MSIEIRKYSDLHSDLHVGQNAVNALQLGSLKTELTSSPFKGRVAPPPPVPTHTKLKCDLMMKEKERKNIKIYTTKRWERKIFYNSLHEKGKLKEKSKLDLKHIEPVFYNAWLQ